MAIFGGVTVAAVVIAAVIPVATAVGLLAPVPRGGRRTRTRPRALIAAAVATTGVTFAMAGTGAASGVFISAIIAGIVGDTKRRGRGLPTIALATLIAAPLIGGMSVVLLWILKPLRELMLTAMKNSLDGLGNWVGRIPGLDGTEDFVNGLTRNAVDYWWAWIWISGTIGTAISIVVAWWVLGAVIDRLADVPAEDTLDQGRHSPTLRPLRRCRWSHQVSTSLTETGLRWCCPELTCGSIRASSSRSSAPTGPANRHWSRSSPAGRRRAAACTGRVCRSGPPQRTAMVLQRPESQMLGSRVADDLVWGCPTTSTSMWRHCSPRSGSPASVSARRRTCRAGSSSGSRWPRHWPGARSCSSPTR